MIRCYYGYKIEEEDRKGLFVYEDQNGWLFVVDDPLKRNFFCVEDIEEELNLTLTLRKVNELYKIRSN